MKKIAIFLVLTALLSVSAFAEGGAQIEAPSGILIENSTGQILFEKDAHQRLAPASVTKVMTMLLTMEALESGRIHLDDIVTASDHAAEMGGSQIYLAPGEQMSVHDMLKSIAVASANDACVAMAEHICGSEQAFVDMMNQKAQSLGMADTHFDNCCGLDSETHYTSAYDIALMSRELLRHEGIRAYTTIWMDTVRDGQFGLTNTNKLVRFYDGATGLKTGFTSKAGYCVSATANRSGMELIAVIMHSDSSAHRNADASGLLNYGFANYALVRYDGADAAPDPVTVLLGKEDSCIGEIADDSCLLVNKAEAQSIEKQISLDQTLTAPVEKGQRIGVLRYVKDGEVLKEVPILAKYAIEKRGVLDIYSDVLRNLMMK